MSPSLTANIFQKRFPHAGLVLFFCLTSGSIIFQSFWD